MNRLVISLIVLASVSSHAADNSNPFVPAAGAALHAQPQLSLDDPLPQSFTENKSIFDLIEVVGRNSNFAVLRYPVSGSSGAALSGGTGVVATASTQGVSYRELVVRGGRNTFIGGHSFKVELPRGNTNVLLVGKNGKVLWEGDLSAPKVYYVNPPATDYQYTPPMSAGAGIGQSVNGQIAPSNSGATGQPAAVMGQGVQQSGANR